METFSEVYEMLDSKFLLTSKNVSDIREYVYKKYPNFSSNRNASIFADAVNKVIEKDLVSFSIGRRTKLRKHILQNAMTKKAFFITAKDVFSACIDIQKEDENVLDEFGQYLETAFGIEVPQEIIETNLLSSNVKISEEDTINEIENQNNILNLEYNEYIQSVISEDNEVLSAFQFEEMLYNEQLKELNEQDSEMEIQSEEGLIDIGFPNCESETEDLNSRFAHVEENWASKLGFSKLII